MHRRDASPCRATSIHVRATNTSPILLCPQGEMAMLACPVGCVRCAPRLPAAFEADCAVFGEGFIDHWIAVRSCRMDEMSSCSTSMSMARHTKQKGSSSLAWLCGSERGGCRVVTHQLVVVLDRVFTHQVILICEDWESDSIRTEGLGTCRLHAVPNGCAII
jgi:hypothetical protein